MNNDIIKRPMQDVIVPRGDTPRPVVSTVQTSDATDIPDRIAKNSFFSKTRSTAAPFVPNEKKERPRRWIWWLVPIFVMGGGVFAVANYFVKATITATPVTYSAILDHEFMAVKNSDNNKLEFQFMSLSEERSRDVPAEEEQKVQKKASGTVVIYNAYNEKSQRLITNTRLETSDHKIFRIGSSVVVPGARITGGKVTPGSVEAVVYADTPGDEYNIGLADFTIPGLKGDPRYEKFTARTKADTPIGGGFDGIVKVPKEEDKESARVVLKEELTGIVMEKARAEIPAGSVFFPGSTMLTFEDVQGEFSEETAARVSIKATVSVFFFSKEDITKKIAETVLPEYRGEALTISNIENLDFSFITPVERIASIDLSQINFFLKGEPHFVGVIDTQKFIQDIVGKDKKDFAKIVTVQENVKSAEATIRPFWVTVFPLDASHISIELIENGSI